MPGDTPDHLFARFRTEGDVAALGEIFDQVAGELLRVARHVAPRSVEPQDLVQATFLIAIQRADSYDPARPVKAWLLGILTKEAAYERRKGSRVVEPDRLEPRSAPAPEVRVSDSELHDALGRALAGLPPKYRQVVAPAILDGAHPRDIARKNGVRAGTVRVQLHRGLRMLRDALPAGFALGAAVTASTSLADARTRILLHGAGRGPGLVGPAPGPWVAGPWQLAAGIALVAAAVWVLLPREDLARAAETPVTAASERPGGRELLDVGTAGSPRGAAPLPAASPSAAEATGAPLERTLVGRVLGLDRRPSAFAEVVLRVEGFEPFRARADASGAFRLRAALSPGLDRDGHLTAVGAEGQAEASAVGLAPEVYVGTVLLDNAIDVPVQVVDARGAGVPGALVRGFTRGLACAEARADTDGRAVLRAVPNRAVAVVARDDTGAVGALAGDDVRRPARGLTVVLGRGGAPPPPGAPPGLVRAPDGTCAVVLRLHCEGRAVWFPGNGRFLHASLPAEVRPTGDGDVSVWVRGAPGQEVLLDLAPEGFVPTSVRAHLAGGALPALIDLELDPLASLSAHVVRGPSGRVVLELQRWERGLGTWGPTNLDWGGLTVPNTGDGAFRFDGLVPGRYRVRDRTTRLCSPPVDLEPGERLGSAQLDLSVLRRVSGRVLVPDPEDLRHARILVEAEHLDYRVNRRTTDQRYQWDVAPNRDGRFAVDVPADRAVVLRVAHPLLVPATGDGAIEVADPTAEVVFELARGPETRLPLAGLERELAPGRLRVLLYPGDTIGEPEGEPLARLHPLVEGDVARFAGVAPGRWTLWIDPGHKLGVRPAVLRDVSIGAETTLLAPLPREAGSSIRFLLEGAAPGHLTAFARRHGEPDYTRGASLGADGTLVLSGLGPGRFTVVVGGPRVLGPLLETEVELDGLHDLELALRAP